MKIETVTGSLEVDVCPDVDTVYYTKAAIREAAGIPIHLQTLSYGKKALSNKRALCYYGITEQDTISLRVSLSGGKSKKKKKDDENPCEEVFCWCCEQAGELAG